MTASASRLYPSSSLFNGYPGRRLLLLLLVLLLPTGRESRNCFGCPVKSVLLTRFKHFYLYTCCANLFSTVSTLNSSKSLNFFCCLFKYPALRLVNFISAVFSLIFLCSDVHISQPFKNCGTAKNIIHFVWHTKLHIVFVVFMP